ncbi:MAG TPA: hypothetical protein VMI94_10525 [Bryobacteraceae bacterium]|nr:hypothetical protein [Bryobacteraceae bacterium]
MKRNQALGAALVVAALSFPMVARADLNGTATLPAGSTLNLDTGATGTSGGDLSFTGASITFQSTAKGQNLGDLGSAGFDALSATEVQALGSFETSTPIEESLLVVGDVFVAVSNGGHSAKVLVTASSSSSITLQYTTFGVTGGGGNNGPAITGVTNNYSYIPTGFPNSGISPSSIFVIFGTGMADAPVGAVTLQSSGGAGLPTTLAGATLSVTVGGTTVTPAMYYAIPTAIAAVMPAGTPSGNGTLTVTYKGTPSNAFPIQVVPSAMGLDTYYGTGSGLIVATSPTTGALYNYTNSATPGETIVMWGSGLGADAADSDSVYTTTPHAVNVPLQIYFGGVAGTVLYRGSSGFPGLNQINVTIPKSVSTGCGISVVAVTGTGAAAVSSNFGTLAISANGGECSDEIYGSNGSLFGSLSGKATVKYGNIFVGQFTAPGTGGSAETQNFASASFESVSGASFDASTSTISLGGCIVNLTASGASITTTGLDAGSLSVMGPAGTYDLQSATKGTYVALLPAGAITSAGGTFTFAGTGGADVGSFSAAVALPNPVLDWTNQSSDATINRGQGVGVTWTGGASDSYVVISGSSTATGGSVGSFVCLAPQSALQFNVPSYVTSTLPAGNGDLFVENSSVFTTFSAPNLDYGFAIGATGTTINVTYQ